MNPTATVRTSAVNVPSIITSAGTALAANQARVEWSIQNLGTNPLFVLRGAGASTTVFHQILKGGTGADDGLGATMSEAAGACYTGIITVTGTSPRFVVTELGLV
jgi:hypothetical protein